MLQERGFADTSFTPEHHNTAAPRPGVVQQPIEECRLSGTADKQGTGPAGTQAARQPTQSLEAHSSIVAYGLTSRGG